MEINYKTHYTEAYFTGKKTYVDYEGKVQQYHGPALTWQGFQLIANTLASLLPKGTLLDIGCSGGDLARYLMQRGFDPYGVEISEYAVQNCVEEMKGRIALGDISSETDQKNALTYAYHDHAHLPGWVRNFPDQFDTVIATDLLEHIYQEDLDKTFSWILSKTKQNLFFCVATVNADKDPNKYAFVAKKGEPIPKEYEATAVSGHVNVRPFKWWCNYFQSKGLNINWQKMYLFQARREMHEEWKKTGGWSMQTTFFLEKV